MLPLYQHSTASYGYGRPPLAGSHGQWRALDIATGEYSVGNLPGWDAAVVRSGPGDVETAAEGSVPVGRWGAWAWRAVTSRSIHASCFGVKGGVSSAVGAVNNG